MRTKNIIYEVYAFQIDMILKIASSRFPIIASAQPIFSEIYAAKVAFLSCLPPAKIVVGMEIRVFALYILSKY